MSRQRLRPALRHALRPAPVATAEPAPPSEDWWDIAGQTAVWAYQPLAAASQAASYIDLTGNGNDAAPGTAPTWHATNGWIFNGINQYLTTPVAPSDEGSLFIRYTNVTTVGYMVAVYHSASKTFGLYPDLSNKVLYENEGPLSVAPKLLTGNVGIAGRKAYRDGVQETGNITTGTVATAAPYIGARHRADITSVDLFCACRVQAAVMYSTTLSAADATELYNRTAALVADPDPAFTMLVKTDNAGVSATNQMQLTGAVGTYTVDWGDGVVEERTGAVTHTYPAPGEYTIRITGGLTAIKFANGGDRLKLLDIQNWGDGAWSTMEQAFWGCSNLVCTAIDAPDLSTVTSAYLMFAFCLSFDGDLSGWDVSNITNMEYMLNKVRPFNSDISGWDVGNVTSMSNFLNESTFFNQDISGWNVSNVTNMLNAFRSLPALDQDFGGWDISKVTNMGSMFQNDTLSTLNYDSLLIGWATRILKPSVSFHGGLSKYSTDGTGNPATDAAAARAKIIADFGWTITDGGPV